MRYFHKIILIGCILTGLLSGFLQNTALAVETAAGTMITNQATVFYSVPKGGSFKELSNIVNLKVDEIIRINATWQNAAEATVLPGSTNQEMSLTLTNNGNGNETLALTIDTASVTDQFDPTFVGFFLDSNNNGIYEPAIDLTSAASLTLLANQSETVFVVNNIPLTRSDSSPLQDQDKGEVKVTISSSHGNGLAGTPFPGDGDNGGTAVFGHAFPLQVDGRYVVEKADVSIFKSSTITDLDGGSKPTPGATITYTLVVSVAGSGTAYNLIVSDPIPANTTYVAESTTLDNSIQTDAGDGDAGIVSGSPVNLITVNLGDQSVGTRAISFKVTIDE